MASGSIDMGMAQEQGTITKASGITSGTLDLDICFKSNGVVTVSGRLHSMSLPAAGDWFQIPEGFRPRNGAPCIAYVNVSGVVHVVIGTIYTSGLVSIRYSNGATTDQVGFYATYHV